MHATLKRPQALIEPHQRAPPGPQPQTQHAFFSFTYLACVRASLPVGA